MSNTNYAGCVTASVDGTGGVSDNKGTKADLHVTVDGAVINLISIKVKAQQSAIGKTQLSRYYNQLDSFFEERYNRASNPNLNPITKSDKDAIEFQRRCAERGVPVQAMLSMDLDELKEVWQNPKATILEKTIANAMRKSLEKGSLYSIETLLSRVYGKPKETADVNQTVQGKVEITLDLGQ